MKTNNQTKGETTMKTRNEKKTGSILMLTLLIALIAVMITACGGDDETPTARSEGTYRTLTYIYEGTPVEGTFGVTIKSDDKYLNAEWNATVDKVIATINFSFRDHGLLGNMVKKDHFETVFVADNDAQVIVSSEANYDIEVIGTESNILYLKSPIADDIDFDLAIQSMRYHDSYQSDYNSVITNN